MNPFDYEFMRSAFIAGGAIALAAGLAGYFVLVRNQLFLADSLGHASFTGGMAALALGLDLTGGLLAGCAGAALLMGALGGRRRGRDVAIGTVFAWVLGLGVLFLSLYASGVAGANGAAGISVLFGSILGLDSQTALTAVVVSLAIVAATLLLARPLLFASLDPDVAAARGVPVRALGVVALLLVAITVAEAVQAVGALLVFALMVCPAAAAQRLIAHPYAAMAAAAALALGVTWAGLVLAFLTPMPAGFYIVTLAFLAYVASAVIRRSRSPVLRAGTG